MPLTIGVLTETEPGETRVALVPEIAARFRDKGVDIVIEDGAGDGAARSVYVMITGFAETGG